MWLQVQFTALISVLDSIPVEAAPPAPAPVTSWLPDPRPPLELWSARDTVVSPHSLPRVCISRLLPQID